MSDPDARMQELAAINCRLQTLAAFIKSRHTAESLERETEQAQRGLGDTTPAFVRMGDGAPVCATRHLGSLLRMVELLELRNSVPSPETVLDECTRLLERKVELMGGGLQNTT